ncbi:Zinc finger, RING/FYVE/PHD-type [Cynara cardunculus var. scolymus]|uniref:Zinc finger, RING/FYVE/PHD-type n=1 Tax=Cynara cardunculus var. scolymus TaxID=59895 RepID=A0A118K4F4_CYNCS|nr:Zinc finger, RING/FYVE/PHD-type [Cynara cardunculus var. scolymus]
MITLVYDVSVKFISCIWVSFLQTKNVFFEILSTLVLMFQPQHYHDSDWDDLNVYPNSYHLSDFRFHDVATTDATSRVVDDACSICLVEFRGDDTVSQLDRCRHVFHACCILMWLHNDHFTCPICRSSLTHMIYCQYVE